MAINVFKLNDFDKTIFYALQTYYGVGPATARKLCNKFGISINAHVSDLPTSKFKQLYNFMDKQLFLEMERRIAVDIDIQRLMQIKSFRGVRLEKGQPVRGQSSRSNGGTQRRRPIKKQVEDKKTDKDSQEQ